jgi:hypothetical protein
MVFHMCLVLREGIEPPSAPCKGAALPLDERSINRQGTEIQLARNRFPIIQSFYDWCCIRESNPDHLPFERSMSTSCINAACLAEGKGIEPLPATNR